MLKQVSLAALSVVVLSACACSTVPPQDLEPATAGGSSMSSGKDGMMAKKGTATAAQVKKANKMLVKEASDRVFFAFDSASLSPDSRRMLKEVAKFVKANNNSINSLVVEGHADERGTREYNLALGDRRAVAVKKFMVGLGVHSSMITTVSYGKERPAVMGHNDEAWAKNRRSVVVIQ